MANDFIPQGPANVTLRELQHGIKLKNPSQLIPLGAMTKLQNLQTSSGGLRLADTWKNEPYDFSTVVGDTLREAYMVFTNQEEIGLMFFGQNFIYTLGADGKSLERVFWGLEVEGLDPDLSLSWNSDMSWWEVTIPAGPDLSGVSIGDSFSLATDEFFRIIEVSGRTLILQEYTDGAELGPWSFDNFRILFNLENRQPFTYQAISLPGNVFFADRSARGLIAYNDLLGLRELPFDTEQNISMLNAVGYHDYRLWLGGMTIDGGRHPNRILWGKRSSPLDAGFLEIEHTSFYLDLVGPKTEIIKILSLGKLLVVYFFDSIFFGRPTNIVGLPYDFEELNTGGLGLVGPEAVCSLADGHYFVGSDDIYFFSAAGSLEKIGSEVLSETIGNPEYMDSLDRTRVIADPKNSRILFLFFGEAEAEFSEVWAYNYEFQAWYNLDLRGQAITQFSLINIETWLSQLPPGLSVPDNEDLDPSQPDYQWNAPARLLTSWADYKNSRNVNNLFLISSNHLYIPGDSTFCEARGEAPRVLLETGDIDFDSPDMSKTVTRLTLKIDVPYRGDVDLEDSPSLEFHVRVSANRGHKYKDCGILRIRPGRDEGKINFLLSGSLFRFQIISTSRTPRYRITEFGLRARAGGLETIYR